ncbi:hypothetical protein [Seonamhaeicola marinus]|uniref:Uncharacterized protein n=1 Tax=Seonamhaeicola marinus TaxID=1912246 RepID=A0A5D0HU68_9FLAO|nr:hypothetical protein [Seonamhaeicola marinus]TYA74858.1 hypothetical protein FUA24_16265 [Seonamhaeicola marinus]
MNSKSFSKNCLFSLLFLLFLTSNLSFSQKREVLENWVKKVEMEFPEISWNSTQSKLRSGSYKYNLIRHHLLSDKFFVPVFDKPFDEMSPQKRNKAAAKINGYKRKGKYPWANRLDWYLWGVLNQPRAYNNAVKEVQHLRQNRKDIAETISLIRSENLDYDRLSAIKYGVSSKYRKLLPSETKYLNNIIDEYEIIIANKSLIAKSKSLNHLNASFESVYKLESFRNQNSRMFNSASYQVQSEINTLIKDRKEFIISSLARTRRERLNSEDFNTKTIAQVNSVLTQLNSSFKKYNYLPDVKSVFDLYTQKKTTYTSSKSEFITKKAKTIYSPKALSSLLTQYTSNTNQNSAITSLTNYINLRKKAIEKIIKEREEERLRKKRENDALIKTNKALVSKLRSDLRIKNESNLPTYEELHYILQSYLTLINSGKTYYVSDAEKFIKLVEDKRFMRKRTNAISGDNETFENSKGFQIKCSGMTSVDGEDFTYTKLIIPNASKDIYKLYALELTSNYRNIMATSMTPDKEPESKDFYAQSGRTLYSLKLDDKGSLVAQAQRNSFANWPLMAERIDYRTLKVTSFSNVTDISLKQGQTISIKASNRIKVGGFAGYSSPDGINGFTSYNKTSRFRHGVLMGKIGKNGTWFFVGSKQTITANKTGRLYLAINDKDVNNNEGHFTVQYEIK